MTNFYTTTLTVPLQIRHENSTMAVKSQLPEAFVVKFRGTGWKILSLYFNKTQWVVELDENVDANQLFINTKKSASQYISGLPNGLVVDDVRPSELKLVLEEKATRKVPVKLNTTLEPSTGYVIINPDLTISPDSVNVSAAKSLIDTLLYWPTRENIIAHLNSSFQITIPLASKTGSFVELSHNEVIVTGKAEQLAEISFEDIRVRLSAKKGSDSVIFIPNRVSVLIGGGIGNLETLTPEQINVFVPFNELMSDTSGSVKPYVKTPTNTKVISIQPETLQYIIRK
jgi:YbbR domain-containing protein